MEAGGNGVMRIPDERMIRELLDWRPELGVLSVYVAIDPADRSEPWRVELRNRLDSAIEAEQDLRDRRHALTATAERIKDHFPEESPPSGRCQIGFCEVTEKDGREFWMAAQMQRDETEVVYRDHPHLTPLLEILDEGAPIGVLAVSSERVRLYEWALGSLSDVQDWEAILFTPDWRERKAQSNSNPTRTQGASSSGHDQFDQRLDANRERFLQQVGGLVRQEADTRRWPRVFAFGAPNQVDQIRQAVGDRAAVELADDADVISESDRGRLLERVDAAVEEANRRREV